MPGEVQNARSHGKGITRAFCITNQDAIDHVIVFRISREGILKFGIVT